MPAPQYVKVHSEVYSATHTGGRLCVMQPSRWITMACWDSRADDTAQGFSRHVLRGIPGAA